MAVVYNYGKHNSLLRWYYPEIDGKLNTNIVVTEYPRTEVKEFSVEMCTQPKLSPEKMYNLYPTNNKPQVLVNCSFFATSTGESIWNLKSNGVVYSTDANYKHGIGIIEGQPNKAIYGEFGGGEGWNDFMTPYPDLILLGSKTETTKYNDINYKAKRQVFGWTKNQETYFHIAVVAGSGCTLDELQNIILKLYPDVYYAGNFDGGGSTYVNVEGKRLSASGYVRPVDSIFIVKLRSDAERKAEEDKKVEEAKKNESNTNNSSSTSESEKKVYYKVQLGAFSTKQRGEAYLAEIQKLKTPVHDYKDAYLKLINGYWKVRCGVFSKKANAEKMMNDLKANGYDCYITTK